MTNKQAKDLILMNTGHDNTKWAKAISNRILDELFPLRDSFGEDAKLLEKVLFESLLLNPKGVKDLIGTTIIEEDYFEKLT